MLGKGFFVRVGPRVVADAPQPPIAPFALDGIVGRAPFHEAQRVEGATEIEKFGQEGISRQIDFLILQRDDADVADGIPGF